MEQPLAPSESEMPEVLPMIPGAQLHPRREPLEHGLLPLPKLIVPDPTQTLAQLKHKLGATDQRVVPSLLAESLQISPDHARLVLDTLASVLPSDSDPLARASPSEIDSIGADLRDLIMFLFIQSYKKLHPRSHKDSAAVADVWPSTSAFDGFLSALSPLQLVRSNSRRFMPSQVDEEIHQLSYLQKHIGSIITLLSDGEEANSLTLSMDSFERLGFLLQINDKPSEDHSLSQTAPFFANSDPDMPAVPVPSELARDWILEKLAESLQLITEKSSTKENSSDQDVTMSDACSSFAKTPFVNRGTTFVEGVSKSFYAKKASDFKASSVKVVNCHDSVIYILAPLRFATIYGCSDATVVLGAVGKAVRIEHCERVHVITAAKRVSVANCRECIFFLGVNQRPLMVGDNHKLQVAPYNTRYAELEEHLSVTGIDASVNKWDEPLALGVIDPHDTLSHPAGVSDAQAESASRMDPDHFTPFLIPPWFVTGSTGITKPNPFPLPPAYASSQHRNDNNLGEIRRVLNEATLEDNQKRELSNALHLLFKDWLYASGNIRQLYCLQGD